MRRELNKKLALIITITLIANLSVIVWGWSIYSQVNSLHSRWNGDSNIALEKAVRLVDLERAFGYNGLIHNFKNYVLRRSDSYREKTADSINQVEKAISRFSETSLKLVEQQNLEVIKHTFNQYRSKFELIQNPQNQNLEPRKLDAIVKVDDSNAIEAFSDLRNLITPSFGSRVKYHDNYLFRILLSTLIGGAIVIPLLIISALLSANSQIRSARLLNENTTMFNASPDGILYSNSEGEIFKANRAAEEIFGYSQSEFLTLKIEDLVPEKMRNKHIINRNHFSSKDNSRRMGDSETEIKGITKMGEEIRLDIAIASTTLVNEKINIATLRNITQELELREKASIDHLTQISNRRQFEEYLDKEIERSRRYQSDCSVLLVDVDHFKKINDQHGHQVGDFVLQNVASFLQSNIRPSDTVARWGGDEFIILCPEMHIENLKSFGDRLILGITTLHDRLPLTPTLSIGATSIKGGEVTSKIEIIRRADEALYEAKAAGRNQIAYCKLSVSLWNEDPPQKTG